jgi:hypothetical protein
MPVAALARGKRDPSGTFVHRSSVDERDERDERSTDLLSRTITLLHLDDPDALDGLSISSQGLFGCGDERADKAGRNPETD